MSRSSRRERVTPAITWAKGALVVALVAVFAAACTAQRDVPALERRAQSLNEAIMCPVCPGESIDQSQNALAVQMRGIVIERLRQGWTESQIKAYFVEAYGNSVLMEPPRSGFNLTVWILPPVGVLAAGFALYYALRLMRRAAAEQPESAGDDVEIADAELADYIRRIEAVLEPEPAPAERE